MKMKNLFLLVLLTTSMVVNAQYNITMVGDSVFMNEKPIGIINLTRVYQKNVNTPDNEDLPYTDKYKLTTFYVFPYTMKMEIVKNVKSLLDTKTAFFEVKQTGVSFLSTETTIDMVRGNLQESGRSFKMIAGIRMAQTVSSLLIIVEPKLAIPIGLINFGLYMVEIYQYDKVGTILSGT
jgi:hypothetical protein